jgi:superfamily II DNA or RNA helicase
MYEELVQRLRAIRSSEEMNLRPSPYLREEYADDFGRVNPVVLRQYQKIGIMNLLQVPCSILGDDTGLGKAQPVDSRVLTPNGWVQIGTLKVGDRVIGSDGRATNVQGVFPQGIKQAFRVTMSDGSSTECCEDHLWTVRSGNTRRFGDGWRTMSLKQIVSGGLMRQKRSTGRRWSIPMVEPVQFPEADLPVDPYLLGVLLGDGSMPGAISVCNRDPKLFDLVESRLPSDCRLGSLKSDGYSRPIVWKSGIRNSLKTGLVELGLVRKNWTNKFVPRQYLTAAVHQRTELLQGLMDTDGYISKDGKITQFYSSNLGLVNDFVELVQSLGGTAKIKSKIPLLRGKSKDKNGRLAYTVTVSLPNHIMPFRLPRKVLRWKPRTKYPPIRYISRVEPSRKVECVCISVEADDNLYVTDQFIITHNTLMVLSTVGYVWMKEPEYTPIILTKKSSLHQWKNEALRFMQGMEVVTVDAEPHQRDAVYRTFFREREPGKKQLLVMTYDTLFKDANQSVVRDKSWKPPKGARKALAEERQRFSQVKDSMRAFTELFEAHFSGRPPEIHDHLQAMLKKGFDEAGAPKGWNVRDGEILDQAIRMRAGVRAAQGRLDEAKDLVEPPKVVPGLISYVKEMVESDPSAKVMLVMDEMHVLKNHKSQIHLLVDSLAKLSNRRIGMTATPVKNRLMEFFSLFRIIWPSLFPMISHFQDAYCVVKFQPIGGGRKVPVVVGYKNLDHFVRTIEPFYLSRRKHDVAKELPELITREVRCELSEEQEELYDLAEAGVFSKGSDADSTQTDIMTAMVRVQQAANSPELIKDEEGNPYSGKSSKIESLIEMLENELDGVKVLVFSRFEQMVSIVGKELDKKKIKYVRITGKENKASERESARLKYQDPKSGINVILITTAGTESLNLQATEQVVFLDSPWSYGDYVQTLGRPIRIGSVHKVVVVTHLVSVKRDGSKTIDQYVIDKLREKKKLADKVAGEGVKGGLQFVESDLAMELFDEIRRDHGDGAAEALERAKAATSAAGAKRSKKKAQAHEKKSPGVTVEERASLVVPEYDFSDI